MIGYNTYTWLGCKFSGKEMVSFRFCVCPNLNVTEDFRDSLTGKAANQVYMKAALGSEFSLVSLNYYWIQET